MRKFATWISLPFLFAASFLVTLGCSSDSDPAPAATSTTVRATSTTAAAFDGQAYCVERLGALKVRYPKSLGGSDLAAECRKMLTQTAATSAQTIDALLESAEGYYKMVG